MAIWLSGMVSGMDTESLVSALVSSYKLKKDNLVKAQTKLSWKQEKWKTMNTNIYGFYSGKLSSARFSTSYYLKTSSVSNDKYAKVTASSSAVNGTQRLKVKQLASTGYLTGGQIKAADGSKITGDTKVSDIVGTTDGSISFKTASGTKSIDITSDMNVNQFVSKLKEAGVNASFDENNARFFISSKESGKDNDFSLVANDSNGLNALQKLGIYTVNDTDSAEYKRLAALTEGSDEYNAEVESMYTKITAEDFVYTWQRMVDPATASEYAYLASDSHLVNVADIIAGNKSVDELGVKAEGNIVIFTLSNPSPQFKSLLSFSNFVPQHKEFVEKTGKQYGTKSDKQIYSGPFKVENWNGTSGGFKLVKNNNYWDAKHVKTKTINIQTVKKPDTAVQMYKQGQLDFASISSTSAIFNSNKKNKDVVTVPEATTSYMTYNETGKVKGLDNFKIRQALNLATDRKGIVEAAVDTGSVPDRSNGC